MPVCANCKSDVKELESYDDAFDHCYATAMKKYKVETCCKNCKSVFLVFSDLKDQQRKHKSTLKHDGFYIDELLNQMKIFQTGLQMIENHLHQFLLEIPDKTDYLNQKYIDIGLEHKFERPSFTDNESESEN
jgi:hypothetical protein